MKRKIKKRNLYDLSDLFMFTYKKLKEKVPLKSILPQTEKENSSKN